MCLNVKESARFYPLYLPHIQPCWEHFSSVIWKDRSTISNPTCMSSCPIFSVVVYSWGAVSFDLFQLPRLCGDSAIPSTQYKCRVACMSTVLMVGRLICLSVSLLPKGAIISAVIQMKHYRAVLGQKLYFFFWGRERFRQGNNSLNFNKCLHTLIFFFGNLPFSLLLFFKDHIRRGNYLFSWRSGCNHYS